MHPADSSIPILEYGQNSFLGEGFVLDEDILEEFDHRVSSPVLNILFVGKETVLEALKEDAEGKKILQQFALTRIVNHRFSQMRCNKKCIEEIKDIDQTKNCLEMLKQSKNPFDKSMTMKQQPDIKDGLNPKRNRQILPKIDHGYKNKLERSKTIEMQINEKSKSMHGRNAVISNKKVRREADLQLEKLESQRTRLASVVNDDGTQDYIKIDNYKNICHKHSQSISCIKKPSIYNKDKDGLKHHSNMDILGNRSSG